jgi:hypothetical protein
MRLPDIVAYSMPLAETTFFAIGSQVISYRIDAGRTATVETDLAAGRCLSSGPGPRPVNVRREVEGPPVRWTAIPSAAATAYVINVHQEETLPRETHAMSDDDHSESLQEVQRLIGRCMLRLQQYEHLLKSVLAHHELAGPVEAPESQRDARCKVCEQDPGCFG